MTNLESFVALAPEGSRQVDALVVAAPVLDGTLVNVATNIWKDRQINGRQTDE
jgi:hypothetical protein